MPARIRKVGNRYRVTTPNGVKAKATTRAKAKRQQRLLNAIDHGYRPKKRRRKKA